MQTDVDKVIRMGKTFDANDSDSFTVKAKLNLGRAINMEVI